MEQIYNEKMKMAGYSQFVCDIFLNWEDVKDEILLPERKKGSGNGTVHVFLGEADTELRKEFQEYYQSVENGEDTSEGAVPVTHYFMKSNVLSMLGFVCQYYSVKKTSFDTVVSDILLNVEDANCDNGLLVTKSLFKLSIGSNKLRPYFKQFEEKGVFHKVIRQLLLPNSAYKVALYKNSQGEYAAFWLIGFGDIDNFLANSTNEYVKKQEVEIDNIKSLQQIFYGAPGTGKSHTIKEQTKGKDVIRTTFHPDTDYSTFVGAYKPTTKEVDLRDLSGHKVIEDGVTIKEDRIVYEFVAQSFLQAYVSAWKKYESGDKQYLIIEEINRGNCAQIFGDLFQLLDRNDYGFSDYPIKADADMKRQLKKAFAGLKISHKEKINALYEDKDVVQQVLDGDILLLPSNLYIWATMNTSDQSLFPIDSAFKRRWDWTYMPISDAGKNWMIEAGGNRYSWWQFLEVINEKIGSTTNSEDKKLGYFFCKAQNSIVSAKTFVGKVIFYLWNDVFKDYEFGDAIFNDEDGSKLSFDKFYTSEGENSRIVEEKVVLFFKNLGLAPLDVNFVENEEDLVSSKNDLTRYSFDGKSKLAKATLGLSIMEKYLSEHKELNYEEIKMIFPDSMLGKIPHARLIVDASEDLQSYSRYYTGIYKTSDNKEFKIYKQWTRGNIQSMIDFAEQQGWSVTIEQ